MALGRAADMDAVHRISRDAGATPPGSMIAALSYRWPADELRAEPRDLAATP